MLHAYEPENRRFYSRRGSVVTDTQRETLTRRIWNKRGAASVWMDASTFNGGAGNPKPSRAASPNGTCRAWKRGKQSRYGGLGCPRRKKMNSCTITTTTELTGVAF